MPLVTFLWVRESGVSVEKESAERRFGEDAKAQELQEIENYYNSNILMQTGDIIFKTAHRIPLHFHFKQTEPKKNSDYLK